MAEKQRFLDVWIVETNTVYKEVPFVVVTDWLQEGRLLDTDQAKPSGSKDWRPLSSFLDLQPFVPKEEPFRADDQAEALEAVHLDFGYKPRHDDEDDEVDMIPLIDVSLVLLVFFMLSASAAAVATQVNTPEAKLSQLVEYSDGLRIDITRDKAGQPVYSVGAGKTPAAPEDRDLRTQAELLQRLDAFLKKSNKVTTDLVINADEELDGKIPIDVLAALASDPFRGRITANFYGVRGAKP